MKALLIQYVALFALGRPALGLGHNDKTTLHIPSEPPANTSDVIDRSFLGFAFEQASFYHYSIDDDGNPNTFSHNLVDAISSRSGGRPIFRVGGTSGDMGRHEPHQEYPVNRPAKDGGPAFHPPFLTVGPSYFEAFKNFPNARFIFMVPLAHRDHNNTLLWARRGLEAIGDRLQAVDIGNEPDLYGWYETKEYVKEYLRCQNALSAVFPEILGQGPMFQALDVAWGGGRWLKTSDVLDAGLNSTGAIKQIAYHLYQVATHPNLGLDFVQRRVVNHTAIVENMAVFKTHINHLKKHAPGTKFILSENGNSLGAQHTELRNIFATALWNVDYQLHAMAIGVDRVNNQQIVFPGYQMWQPVDTKFGPRLVRPNFYSQPLLAEFIGTSGKTRVAEIEIPNSNGMLSAHVAYEDDVPVRIAIVNFELWHPTDGERPNAQIKLKGLHKDIRSVKVHKLSSPDGASGTRFITWRGLQWTSESNGQEVQVGRESEREYVKDGKFKFDLEATSAVIIELENCWDIGLCHEL